MRRTAFLVVTMTLVVGAFGALGGFGASADAARAGTPLVHTNWVLTNRVSIGTPLDGVAVNAVFDGSRVNGSSGCNGYSWSYTTNGARMTLADDGVHTLIACEGAAGTVEHAYLARLGRVGRYRVTGSNLTLSTRTGRRLLVYRASIGLSALKGGWNATSFYSGTAVRSPAAGSALTLEFAGDRASGNSGCNTFDGPVKVSGVDRITLGPFRSTLKACADDAVNAQEQQYLAALGMAKTYEVTGNRLTLYRDGHTIAATFDRAQGLTSGS
jgi:heat shock protein HslJ